MQVAGEFRKAGSCTIQHLPCFEEQSDSEMCSQTWKSILQSSVTRVVKELEFSHWKYKESINRKNVFFKTT